jgi:hypothetical protein
VRPHNFYKLKRPRTLRFVSLLIQLRRIAVEYKYHQPRVFGIVSLPSAQIPRCFYFDSLVSVCFIRCLENSFRYFGGVPKTTVIDNLRAAVTRADWYDPEINRRWRSFAGITAR